MFYFNTPNFFTSTNSGIMQFNVNAYLNFLANMSCASLWTTPTSTYTSNPYSNLFQYTCTTNRSATSKASSSKTSSKYKSSNNTSLGQKIVQTAKKYLGYNEADGSYKVFTNGRKEAWCADFVSYVVKEACKKTGKAISGFYSSSVSSLLAWAKRNGCYLNLTGKSNRKELVKKVKAGDVIIFKGNGKSHTGVVSHVAADGTIHTIEGNTSDKVAKRQYSPNDTSISGFVQIA